MPEDRLASLLPQSLHRSMQFFPEPRYRHRVD
jgi:hypothetical protein